MSSAAAARLPANRIDPETIDWSCVELPQAWPDRLALQRPGDLVLFLRRLLGRRRPVELPPGLPLRCRLPPYVLQEFHHLPNGNYSHRVTEAYVAWFDRSMLGKMRDGRGSVAAALTGCSSVIDLGTGAGQLAQMLVDRGAPDVWGIDASPYLLVQAARRSPGVKFLHGLAEQTGFADQRFDGVGACFLFHELEPPAVDAVLRECWRILKPGGILAVTEPSPDQLREHPLRLWWRAGFAGFYFGSLARVVHEPMVERWHERDLRAWLDAAGFELLSDETRLPFRSFKARKREEMA